MTERMKLVDGSSKSLRMVARVAETINEVLRSLLSERLGGQ